MRKAFLNIMIAVFSVALTVSAAAFFCGSLEAFPTEEQMEKAKAVSLLSLLISLIADVIVIRSRRKQ